MARPLRIEFPGAYYHDASRGNERKPIFRDARDREKFLDLLASTEPRYVTSYLLGRYYFWSLREIGEIVGLHYSAVGNAIRRVRESPTRAMAKPSREIEDEIRN